MSRERELEMLAEDVHRAVEAGDLQKATGLLSDFSDEAFTRGQQNMQEAMGHADYCGDYPS